MTSLVCAATGGHCSHDPQDECEFWGCLKHTVVNCSTCGDKGVVMDGGNLDDCPACEARYNSSHINYRSKEISNHV